MLALIIALVGIGFILGIAFADIVIAKPLRKGLMVIQHYGNKNSGYGYTCSRIAKNTIEDKEPLHGVKFK